LADSTEDSIQLLIQLPATYMSSGDGLHTGLNQTLIAAMEPSVKLHISNQWLDMVFDMVPMPDGSGKGAAACAQADSTPGNATALKIELTTALGIAEASVTLACTVRAIASAGAGRRKLQVRGRMRQDATLIPHLACPHNASATVVTHRWQPVGVGLWARLSSRCL
jgi:hypothetical protein